jgi:transposase InsO family protein
MPWKTQNAMQLRLEFVLLALQAELPFSQLCRRFQVSRQTGYKWIERYQAEGHQGLIDREKRPRTSPNRTSEEMETQVLEMRTRHPAWSAHKIGRRLRDQGVQGVPADSTINSILHRHGRISEKASADATPWTRFERDTPNELWQMDFKGHFAMSDQTRCHPLTVLDDHSRFNVVLKACRAENTPTVREHLREAFARYGLPLQINTDNGGPWGSPSKPGEVTELAIWLIRLGIRLTHSRPYHPQTNGKDERFHRSLKVEVITGRNFVDPLQVQAEFDRWRDIYNLERPHEGIDMAVPQTRYQPSPRVMPETLAPIEYGPDDQVMRVGWNGQVTFRGHRLRVSSALHRLDIAARPSSKVPDAYDLFFMHHRLMTFDPNEPDAPS